MPGVITGPTPTGAWRAVTANLADLKSQCGNMSFLTVKPTEDLLIAGVALDGLWASNDGAQTWTALGQGSKSAMIINRPSSILYDPSDPNSYWETGIYNGGGAYKTSDDGVTFTALGDVMHDDFISADFGDPDRKTLLVSGHEADHLLRLSTDAGATWKDISANEPPEAGACSYPIVVDPQTFLLGCRTFGSGISGIYRSTDAGQSWSNVSLDGAAAAPLFAADGSIYVASDFQAGVVRSTDQGQTWTELGAVGVIDPPVPLVQLPDGRIASVSAKRVVVSADNALTWRVVSVDLPYNPVGLVYSQWQKAFYVWHFSCDATDTQLPADAILAYDFDYQQQ